jgi:hypothetical protein
MRERSAEQSLAEIARRYAAADALEVVLLLGLARHDRPIGSAC